MWTDFRKAIATSIVAALFTFLILVFTFWYQAFQDVFWIHPETIRYGEVTVERLIITNDSIKDVSVLNVTFNLIAPSGPKSIDFCNSRNTPTSSTTQIFVSCDTPAKKCDVRDLQNGNCKVFARFEPGLDAGASLIITILGLKSGVGCIDGNIIIKRGGSTPVPEKVDSHRSVFVIAAMIAWTVTIIVTVIAFYFFVGRSHKAFETAKTDVQAQAEVEQKVALVPVLFDSFLDDFTKKLEGLEKIKGKSHKSKHKTRQKNSSGPRKKT